MIAINPFAIPPILSSLAITYIGLRVALKNPQSKVYGSLFYFCLSLSLWLYGYSAMYLSSHPESALFFARLGFIGVAFIPMTHFYFNVKFLNLTDKKFQLGIFLAFSLIFALLGFSSLIYQEVLKFYWGFYPIAGSCHILFLVYYIFTWLYGVSLLYRNMMAKKDCGDYESYKQIRYILAAWLGAFFGMVDFFPKYKIPIYPFAYLIAIYWVAALAALLLRFRFLPYLLGITRKFLISTCFVIVVIGLIGCAYFLHRALQEIFPYFNSSIFVGISAMGIGMLFYPLLCKTESVIDGMFYHEFDERKKKIFQTEEKILKEKDPVKIGQIVLEYFFSAYRAVNLSLFLWDESIKKYVYQKSAGWGISDKKTDPNVIEENTAIPDFLSRNDYLLIDRSLDSAPEPLREEQSLDFWMDRFHATLGIPIKKDHLLGFILLGKKESGLNYTKKEISEFKMFADMMEVAQRAKSHEEKSIRDPLTNLYNRRKIEEDLLKTIDRAKSVGKKMTLIMADIDDFKSVNSNYSYQDGDKVIKNIADIIGGALRIERAQDRLFTTGRLGGEEFLMILGDTSSESAKKVIDRIIKKVGTMEILAQDGEKIKSTLSFGVAEFPRDGTTAQEMIGSADEMLRKAKQMGKNRVVFRRKTGRIKKLLTFIPKL